MTIVNIESPPNLPYSGVLQANQLPAGQLMNRSGIDVDLNKSKNWPLNWFPVPPYKGRSAWDTASETITFEGPWNEHWMFRAYMLGWAVSAQNGQQPTALLLREIPHQHPSMPWLYAMDAEIVDAKGVWINDYWIKNQDGSPNQAAIAFYDYSTGKDYQAVQVAVTYRRPRFEVRTDDEVYGNGITEMSRFLERQSSLAIDALSLPATPAFQLNYVNRPGGPNAGGGATGTAQFNLGTGTITGVTITNPGNGYTNPPSVSFTGGGGTGAAGTATIAGGQVTGVTMTNNGQGYTFAPTVSFSTSGTISDPIPQGSTRILLNTAELTYIWRHVPDLPFAQMLLCAGKVNGNNFDPPQTIGGVQVGGVFLGNDPNGNPLNGYPPGTVLCPVQPKYERVDAPDGRVLYDLIVKYLVRIIPINSDGSIANSITGNWATWNHFPVTNGGTTYFILGTVDGTENGQKLYSSVDQNQLYTLPNPPTIWQGAGTGRVPPG